MPRRLLILIAVVVVGLAVSASSRPPGIARASPVTDGGVFNYPRLALYDGNRSSGYPLVNETTDLPDPATLDQVSKYGLVTLEATPFTDVHTDVIAALRQRNSKIKILAYVLPFYAHKSYSNSQYYYQKLWALANDSSVTDPNAPAGPNNSWLYLQDGTQLNDWYANINLAKRTDNGDGTYTYTAAIALADLMIQNIVQKTGADGQPLVNGMFFDGLAYDIIYLDAAYHFDYARAGYADNQSFRDGWKAAVAVFAGRIRQAAGADFILSANSGSGTADLYATYNGWMYENFPLQEGGSWQTNMFWIFGGYYFNERLYRSPPHNFLFSWASSNIMNNATNIRQMRFGLATASMTSGWTMFGNSTRGTDARVGGYRYDLWWYDEYAVNPVTGQASTSLADTGWLGQPTSGMYQMIGPLTTPERVTNPDFEQDLTGWSNVPAQYGTLARDTTTAASGNASAKLHINQASSIWYEVNLTTGSTTSVSAGRRYAATFWAKASTARRINVVIAPAGQPSYAEQLVPLTADWQQSQVVLTPNGSGSVYLRLDLSETAGDVWIDDIHLQEGVSNVYRRDFEHGTVLVNPDNADRTVTLDKPYWTIAGTVDPVTNDGRQVTTVTVKAQDGLFLLDRDLTPPAAITDLTASG